MPKSALRFPLIILFGIYTVYGCVLTPIMEIVAADVVLINTMLYDVLDVFYNLFEVLGSAASFGFLIHSIYTYGTGKCSPLYTTIGGALLFKYVTSLIAVSIVRGSLDLTADYTSLIASFFIEIAVCIAVIVFAHNWVRPFAEENKVLANASRRLNKEFDAFSRTFSFKKPFQLKNPLQRTLFWGMILLTAVRLISFLVGDISFAIIWGLSYKAIDVLVLFVYSLLLIFLPALIGYLFALTCILLAERKKK